MRFAIAFFMLLFLSSTSEAQLFRRSTRAVVTPSQGGHWGYPGDIATHLATSHGQQVSGLSHAQMVALHDALHEGRQYHIAGIKKMVPATVKQPFTVARPTVQSKPTPKPERIETPKLPSL